MAKAMHIESFYSLDWIRTNVTTSIDAKNTTFSHHCDGRFGYVGDCHWMDCYLPTRRAERSYDLVKSSLAEHGFLRPLCIQEQPEDQFMMGNGHHRLTAAIDLGFTEIPLYISSTEYMEHEFTELPFDEWAGTVSGSLLTPFLK